MGCFDTVYMQCPKCDKRNEVQTKAGECNLKIYSYQQVPLAIAEDIVDTKITCKCGIEFKLTCPVAYIRMDLTLTGKCLY